MRILSARYLTLAAALALPAGAHAQTDLFALDRAGNQSFGGLLGWDFHTGSRDVAITRIAAFDDGKDGFANTITVRLWNRANGDQYGEDHTFQGQAGTLVGSFRYITLATPIIVKANTFFGLYAFGFGDADRNYTTWFPPNTAVPFDGGSGLVNYELAWYLPPGAPVATQDPSNSWGAASFTFQDAATLSAVPEPATVALVGGGLLTLAGVARRRRRPA